MCHYVSEVRWGGREELTPRMRSGAAAGRSYPTPPSPRPGVAAGRSNHTSKVPRLCGHRKF